MLLLSCPLFVCSILFFLLPYNKSFIVELEWHDGLDYEGKEMCWGGGKLSQVGVLQLSG